MDKKDVYLCYNSADRQWVENFAVQIESETIDGNPDSRHISVFFDRWDMDIGDSLISKMNEGLRIADFVVTVLTPEFLAAPWPEFEWKDVVSEDPTNSKGRLIPVMLRKTSLDNQNRIELVAPFRDLKWIDFSDQSRFNRSFADLIRRVRRQPIPRGVRRPPVVPGIASQHSGYEKGSSWHPDAVEEFLPSNLLSVASLPKNLYCAPTPHRRFNEIWRISPSVCPFLLKSGMLYTFSDLSNPDELLASFVDTKHITKVETAEWLGKLERRPWLVELLNRCLSTHLWRQGLKCVDRRFYFPPGKSDLRKVQTLSGFNRTVAKEIGTEAPTFWFHMGCRARFMILGDKVAVLVDPCFLFTVDGSSPVNGKSMGKLTQIWGGKQQNDHIFRDILFWLDVIRGVDPDDGVFTGAAPIYFAALPLLASAVFGIEGDKINFKALRKMEGYDLKDIAEEIL